MSDKPDVKGMVERLGQSILPDYINGNRWGMYLSDDGWIAYSEEYVGKTQDKLIELLKTGELP
jgi:hypothetical protein